VIRHSEKEKKKGKVPSSIGEKPGVRSGPTKEEGNETRRDANGYLVSERRERSRSIKRAVGLSDSRTFNKGEVLLDQVKWRRSLLRVP